MRLSSYYLPTLREAPADADLVSSKLLIRGGFVRKVAAGIFVYLPLGLRVLKKAEQIVREEMNSIGCIEVLMPIMQPAEMWHTSGRWEDYGPDMMKLRDRHERDFALGPTHEEIITTTLKNELNSYRQLPLALYQITTKFRDEIRPRFGLMRAREFLMKDAYSFHADYKCFKKAYDNFYAAYSKIMQRIGLRYIVVEADTGAIGGSESHEFNVIASSGEGKLLFCDCGYAASDEKAEYSYSPPDTEDSALPIERVMTPNVRTIEQVARFLNVDKSNVVKSLLYKGRDSQIMVLIRGDQELNEAKLRAAMGDQTLVLVPPDEVSKQLGVEAGFVGPAGLPDEFELIADLSVKRIGNAVVGAMERDMHFKNAREGRDFSVKRWEDLKIVREGDPCPKCSQPLQETRGIELGHIFNLGTKYSEAMGALFNSDEGVMKPFIMGCYGWGISRTISAVVEQLHDKDGIIWPRSVAPFEILILPLAKQDSNAFAFADGLYHKLLEKGYEVLIDDRDASPGVKFKDADLIGIPLRITIGRSFSQNKVELKLRDRSADVSVDIIEGTGILLEKIEQLLDAYNPAGRGREEA